MERDSVNHIFISVHNLFFRCEADPAALAKYVLALIKKDKSEEELRKSMVAQLDVFLEGGKYYLFILDINLYFYLHFKF